MKILLQFIYTINFCGNGKRHKNIPFISQRVVLHTTINLQKVFVENNSIPLRKVEDQTYSKNFNTHLQLKTTYKQEVSDYTKKNRSDEYITQRD